MNVKVRVKLTQGMRDGKLQWKVREVQNSLWPVVGELLGQYQVEELIAKARGRGWLVTITEEK